MISVELVSVQNFMNYGQSPTELIVDSHKNAIITGKNGSGKSSILLDSLCYGFYGKGYRSVKASQLINSINGKKMLVKIKFSKGSDRYEISRGQKPSVFEIKKNDEVIDEKALVGSYQEYLEDVLGMNFMTFKQIVVIGSANYIPFMRLSTPQRREIVETMLPVSIYAEAGKIARERLSTSKSSIVSIDAKIEATKSILTKTNALLKAVREDSSVIRSENEASIKNLENDIDELKKSKSNLEKDFDQNLFESLTESYQKFEQAESKASRILSFTEGALSSDAKLREFYAQDECPTCSQKITEETRNSMYSKIDSKLESTEKNIGEMQKAIDVLKDKKSSTKNQIDNLKVQRELISGINSKIESLERELRSMNRSIQQSYTESSSEESLKQEIATGVKTLEDLMQEKSDVLTSIEVQQYCIDMFKDSGIKSMIVGEFIPLMNKKINEYLEKFDLFVDFELDSEFNETIKSRHRDTFSYNSFSEGEKQRIDLAILFAWRSIAMEKNSASTNLIIFDETLDQSLDADAVDGFTDILEDIGGDVHVFVVSHKDMIPETFDRWIQVEKRNDFAYLTEQ